MEENINYADLMELGFKRINCNDTVWEKIHGYPYFIVQRKLKKRVKLCWDIETHEVEMIKHDKHGTILKRYERLSLPIIKALVEMFSKDEKEKRG
jgi:hypothetical protein